MLGNGHLQSLSLNPKSDLWVSTKTCRFPVHSPHSLAVVGLEKAYVLGGASQQVILEVITRRNGAEHGNRDILSSQRFTD